MATGLPPGMATGIPPGAVTLPPGLEWLMQLFGQGGAGGAIPTPPPAVVPPPLMPPGLKDQSQLPGGAGGGAYDPMGASPFAPQDLTAAAAQQAGYSSPIDQLGPDTGALNTPVVPPAASPLGDAMIGTPDPASIAPAPGEPMNIDPTLANLRGGAGGGLAEIMQKMALSGVRAPTVPEPPRISTPNAPQTKPVESKLLQLLAMRQAGLQQNPLLRLGQALGGR